MGGHAVRVGSLFSGIGGFDLGLERAGMSVAWQCEIDPDARAILAKHWPEVPCYGDIRSIDWSTVEPVDIVCGGYPCQPFSHAGSRAGESDPRHLWPEVARCVRHLRPRWVLLENVAGHLSLGFGAVLGDLAALGYDAWWDCIPAAALGAPHLRDRVFVVAWRATADANDGGHAHESADRSDRTHELGHASHAHERRSHGDVIAGGSGDVGLSDSDPDRVNAQVRDDLPVKYSAIPPEKDAHRGGDRCAWIPRQAPSPVRRMDDGVPVALDVPRLRGLGNAIVPQIPELLGRIIMEVEQCR